MVHWTGHIELHHRPAAQGGTSSGQQGHTKYIGHNGSRDGKKWKGLGKGGGTQGAQDEQGFYRALRAHRQYRALTGHTEHIGHSQGTYRAHRKHRALTWH